MIWRRRRLYYSHPVRTSRWSVALYFLFRNAKDYKDYVIILRRVGDTGNLGENIESLPVEYMQYNGFPMLGD